MAVKVNISVELNGTVRQINKLIKETNSLDVPLRQSAVYMEGSIARRFRAGGGSQGKWKKLAPSTLLRHPHRAGGKPLNDTGKLKMSVTAGSAQRITNKKLYYGMGTGVVYGASHNFGYKQIPQREFLYFDEKDERAIKKVFENYIKGLIDNG